MVMLPRVFWIILVEYFSLRGPRLAVPLGIGQRQSTLWPQDSPTQIQFQEEYDVKITITPKEKEQLSQKQSDQTQMSGYK